MPLSSNKSSAGSPAVSSCTTAQLFDDILVELLDADELLHRHVGNLLDAGEAFLHQHVRHILVDVELLHEAVSERHGLGFTLGFGLGFTHDVELPAGELAGKAHVLTAAADGLR